MKLTFLGAVGTVTGSKSLLEADGQRILIDCGLYQGIKKLRERNWKPLPVEPSTIDAVLLTHAHIDHSGLLPALVRDGFSGSIFCTGPTRALCGILLPDAGRIQEEDAGYANRKGFSRHQPALPLYNEADAERALTALVQRPFDEWTEQGAFRFRFRRAGHILGAASIEVEHRGRSILFSGDLGREEDLLMKPPAPPGDPDWVVIESTYGNRLHLDADPLESLAKALRETLERGGTLLIPSFAVGRAQTMLYCFHEIFRKELAPRVPVFVDSPMATNVTDLFRRSCEQIRLPEKECSAICDVAQYTRSPEESKRLTARREPAVIISASGMATGGRVLHHLKSLAPHRRNTILFPGFQAPGTRGDAMVHGATHVKIHGSKIPIAASVQQLDIFSAHADQAGLLAWLGRCEKTPSEIFINHGEEVAADALRREIKDTIGLRAVIPEHEQSFELG